MNRISKSDIEARKLAAQGRVIKDLEYVDDGNESYFVFTFDDDSETSVIFMADMVRGAR